MIRARVTVLPKRSVVDPQGAAVLGALRSLGHEGVEAVHVGRIVDLELTTDDAATAREQVAAMCDELLANAVIERWSVELESVPTSAPAGADAVLVGAGASAGVGTTAAVTR